MSAPITLLPYQAAWVGDPSPLKVAEKSRRIGFSWATAYEAVMHASTGVGNVYYQSYDHDMVRGFINDAADWAERIQKAVSSAGVEEDLLDVGTSDPVQVFRLRMGSGKEILAMTSAPRAFRSKGRPGDKGIIDEAAFIDDLDEVLKAALAFLMWGGSIEVMSTHNGDANPFAALVSDIKDGVRPGSLHTVTLSDALADGLFRRICEVRGIDWTPEAEAAWGAEVRAFYADKAAEELDCLPTSGTGVWLEWALIRAAEHADAGDPQRYSGGTTWMGVDVARRRNLWVAFILEEVPLGLMVRELRVERNIPFARQYEIVKELDDRYHPVRILVDQGGMGEAVVEHLQTQHGASRVEGVLLQGARRLDVATALREGLEDRRLWIPADADLRADLHAVRAEQGRTGGTRLVADDDREKGHADRFWALALACAGAASVSTGPPEHEVVQGSAIAEELGLWLPPGMGQPAGLFGGWL